MTELIIKVLLIWNVIVFGLYGIDKYKAVRGRWRISEAVLIGCAFAFGSPGAAAGMAVFHHKTCKLKFKVGVPLAAAVNIAAAAAVMYLR